MKYTYLMALAGLAVAASTGFCQTSVPIVDPSFESSSTGAGTHPAGWTTTTGSNIVSTYGGGFPGGDGSNRVEDFSFPAGQYSGAAAVSQTLTTDFVAGATYTLTALAAYNNSNQPLVAGAYFFITNPSASFTSTATVDASVSITGAGSTMSTFTISGYTPTVSDIGQPIVIGFYAPTQTNQGQTTAEIDDFVLTVTSPVPEPSSIALAAFGGFGLLGAVLRRRRV